MSELENPAAFLAAIVSSSDDAIVSKDLQGYVTSWNRAAERMFGFPASEAIGQRITIIIPEDRLQEEDDVLARLRAGETVQHFETIRRTKDGRLIDVSLSISPIRSPGGEIVGASKIARDITEQRRLLRAAEDASRAKDEFLATLSHELRTPLNTVIGYTRMLQSGAIGQQDLAKTLDIIGRNADTLTRLVNDVLDTSRIVTGKIRLVLQQCDVGAIAEEAVAAIAPAATGRSIHVISKIERGLLVRGDPDRLRQVFWNLLTNAVKFTPEGGTLKLSTVQELRSVRIIVEDTGIGVAPEALPYVFDRFWQADPAQTRAQGGLGLGLALSRTFVELHGGHLEARSEGLGRGTRFDIVLPLASVSVSTDA